MDVLTAADVRRQDAACEARGIPAETLMERAGFNVARVAREVLGTTYGSRVVVVCGKGNNAGDGLVAGRWLASWGAHVTAAMVLGNDLRAAARANLGRFPGRVVGPEGLQRELDRADLVLDAVFGVGLSRAPEGPAAEAIDAVNACSGPVISVDVPSGMDADTGRALGDSAVLPQIIVTLGGLKPGLLFAPDVASRIEVVDIGVPEDERGGLAIALEEHDIRAVVPVREAVTNKRRVGTVLVVAGSRAMPGAAALVSGASVHAGAGLTTLAACEDVTRVVVARHPEITTIPFAPTEEGTIGEKALEAIRPRLGEFHAMAVGPGLGTHPDALEAVRKLVWKTRLPLVLDADGITAFAGFAEVLRKRNGFTVITPHEGELGRLMGADPEEIRADRLGAAREAAAMFGCAVLLKGPGTVVTASHGPAFLNITGNRGLAQGGTGDVLTGIVAALLAQCSLAGIACLEAVAAAAWIHGRAADIAAERVAPHPSSASMLVDLLPAVLHEVFS